MSAIGKATGATPAGDLAPELRAPEVSATQSAVGKVVADAARLEDSYAGSIICERVELGHSAAASIQADSALLRQSAAALVRSADARIEQGSTGIVVADSVSGEGVQCGILCATKVEGDVRCLIDNWWVAVAGGLAMGAGLAIVELLIRHRRRQD